jgi:hypothetical protein
VKKKYLWLSALLLLLLLGVAGYIFLRPRPTDEEQVIGIVNRLKVAAEDKSAGVLMEDISPDYRDATGITRDELRAITLQYAHSRGKVTVNILDYAGPTIKGDTATLQLNLEIKYQESGAEQTVNGKVDLTFRKQQGRWLLTSSGGWQHWIGEAGINYDW